MNKAKAYNPEYIQTLKAKDWLSRKEFSILYDIPVITQDRHRKAGILEYTRVGGRVLVRNKMPMVTM